MTTLAPARVARRAASILDVMPPVPTPLFDPPARGRASRAMLRLASDEAEAIKKKFDEVGAKVEIK